MAKPNEAVTSIAGRVIYADCNFIFSLLDSLSLSSFDDFLSFSKKIASLGVFHLSLIERYGKSEIKKKKEEREREGKTVDEKSKV